MPHTLAWRDIELQGVLGEGHSGIVHRGITIRAAKGLPIGTAVAVKRYKRAVLDEPGQLERMFRELNAGRTIRHPNLVEVVAAVMDSDGRPALIMRYYDGPTLESVLAKKRSQRIHWSIETALSLVRQLASGIRALHQVGFIHRDIKPANVILTTTGPVIGDLGVVKSENYPEQTTTGAFLGTLRYAAPEFILGEQYDQRVDIYSLGAIIYELFMGRQLFERHQHWAHLVAIKVSHAMPSQRSALEELAARSSLQLARFVELLLNLSLCREQQRRLDLSSLITAIEGDFWLNSYGVKDGVLYSGEPHFDDRFETAEAAATHLRQSLTERQLQETVTLFKGRVLHGWISPFDIRPPLFALLEEHGAVKKTWTWSRVDLSKSVLEAIVRGLL